MGMSTIYTIKDLCKPIGRENFAIDFPLETGKINWEDLKPLIGREVTVQTRDGKFDFLDKEYEHNATIIDISSTNLIVKALEKKTWKRETVVVPLDTVSLIEWSERIVKRISVRKGATER